MSEEFIKLMINYAEEIEQQRIKNNRVMWDLMDRYKETIASYLEQNKINKKWAKDFLKIMELERQ